MWLSSKHNDLQIIRVELSLFNLKMVVQERLWFTSKLLRLDREPCVVYKHGGWTEDVVVV